MRTVACLLTRLPRATVRAAFYTLPLSLASVVMAASGTGVATATVISDVSSQPLVFAVQATTPQVTSALFPVRLGFSIFQTRGTGTGNSVGLSSAPVAAGASGSSFGVNLLNVDAAGFASFSVAGSTTSAYVVRFPTSLDALLQSNPAAAGDCNGDVASNQAQGCGGGRSASPIIPEKALANGQLSFELSQAQAKLLSGELSVQVNFN